MTGGVTVERPLVVFGAQDNFDSSEVNSTFVVFFMFFYSLFIKQEFIEQRFPNDGLQPKTGSQTAEKNNDKCKNNTTLII